jgi:uncharacterized protein YbbC (DUF1343 family)
VTNDAARLASDGQVHSRTALRAAGVPLTRLFGPEHGVPARAPDGAIVADTIDELTGLPVVSLYGDRLQPDAAHLADLDAVLFDVPDIGVRCYTYAWTLWHMLHACANNGVPLTVLDRPNPLGGVLAAAEGPVLELAHRSFIGEDDIPVRHSLTLGELARLWQREHCPHADLTVIPCDGWQPARSWRSTGLPWVPTSPAITGFSSAVWYPATCWFEATNVSVGRGWEAPFTVVGAPWMDGHTVAQALSIPGVRLLPWQFTPTTGPHAGHRCTGIRLGFTDERPPGSPGTSVIARAYRPVALGLALLLAVARVHERAFAWAPYPTAANPMGQDHLARLLGRGDVAAAVPMLASASTERQREAITRWTATGEWAARVAPILLYDAGRIR